MALDMIKHIAVWGFDMLGHLVHYYETSSYLELWLLFIKERNNPS